MKQARKSKEKLELSTLRAKKKIHKNIEKQIKTILVSYILPLAKRIFFLFLSIFIYFSFMREASIIQLLCVSSQIFSLLLPAFILSDKLLYSLYRRTTCEAIFRSIEAIVNEPCHR